MSCVDINQIKDQKEDNDSNSETKYKDFYSCLDFLKHILNKLSPRFTKKYLQPNDIENAYMYYNYICIYII